ncbi:MAG: F0F1 ATP synthase subunit epsilon [Anaerolineae bacterium]|nr:F0F1 ATP synthase subunit epsilon [Anaerolineae bacterium]
MLRLEIITVEGKVFEDNVSMVIAPGTDGVLGILARHTPLMTTLTYGELQIKTEEQPDQFFAIGGGFMEVRPYNVTILADSAERAEEIDVGRARAARERAETILTQTIDERRDFSRVEAALQRSRIRLKVARRQKSSQDRRRPTSDFNPD